MKKYILPTIIAPILGFLSFAIPILVATPKKIMYGGNDIFSLTRIVYEKFLPIPTIAALISVGFILSIIQPKHWLIIGISTIAWFPLLSIFELLMGKGSHNLFPFEFLIYVVLMLPGLLGALGGRMVKRHF